MNLFISQETLSRCEGVLNISQTMRVSPKGVKAPINIHEVVGMTGKYALALPVKRTNTLCSLPKPFSVNINSTWQYWQQFASFMRIRIYGATTKALLFQGKRLKYFNELAMSFSLEEVKMMCQHIIRDYRDINLHSFQPETIASHI